jgi:molybdopterin molybdotransferase
MISVTAAKKLITDNTETLKPVNINLGSACGQILAADIFAKHDVPGFRQSSMDGYAFRFMDNAGSLRLVGEMAAGTNKNIAVHLG